MEHLIAIALGPVQEFIASARRFRDFFAGSRLLSEAAAKAALSLAEAVGPQNLIFPAPESLEDLETLDGAGILNLLLAKVPSGLEPAKLGEAALKAARDYLREEAMRAFGPHQEHLRLQDALKQVEDLLEGYYAYLPLKEGYAKTRRRLMALLAARKTTRDFRLVSWGTPLYKSSLDGARESVLALKGDEARLRLRLGLREGEHLSGPDLLKRLWEAPSFLSATHMAALPFWFGVKARGAQGILEAALEEVANLAGEKGRAPSREARHPVPKDTPFARFNVRLLYETRLEEFPSLAEDPGRLEAARRRLGHLWEELRKKGVKAPPGTYYALLLADGDQMGKTIDQQDSPEVHRKLSRTQALEFAQKVQEIVVEHQGSLIYSGGDDVLAVLPLHTALRAAWALARRFREVLAPYGRGGEGPTLSVGMAIVHHLEHLQDALELVRQAEKVAKEGLPGGREEEKKNASAITYSPRSGSEITVRGRHDEDPRLTQRLYRYADLLRTEEVPTKAVYELWALLQEAEEFHLSEEALLAEARRILGRKAMEKAYREELGLRLEGKWGLCGWPRSSSWPGPSPRPWSRRPSP